MRYFDRVKIYVGTTGTGDVEFGAPWAAFLGPSDVGAVEGDQTPYCLMEGVDFEVGVMTIGADGATGSREVIVSKIGGVVGTSKLSLGGNATLIFTIRAIDVVEGLAINTAGPVADRGDFDSKDPGFTYFGTDTELVYFRLDAGGWSDGSAITGADGVDGATWLSGSTDPSNGSGSDGDFYFQTGTGSSGVAGDTWKKASGTWSKQINLKGPPGSDGTDGTDGTDGADGRNFEPDEVVPDLTGRDAYDAGAKNFAVLVESDSSNDNLPTLYFKLSATSGDWSDGFTFEGGGGGGDVAGPASATDGNIALFDGTTGKLLKDGGKAISDFATAAQGAPSGGTTGQVLAKIDGTDYNTEWVDQGAGVDESADYDWTGQHTFTKALEVNPTPASLTLGIDVEQTPSGSSGSGQVIAYNTIRVTEDDASTPGLGYNLPFFIYHEFGGSNMQGARIGSMVKMTMTDPSSASNTFRQYVGMTSQLIAASSDNGTDTSTGADGSFFATNFYVAAEDGATNLVGLIGSEVNIEAKTGSSMNRKIGWNIVATDADKVQGVQWDAAYSVSSQGGAVGWRDGLLFSDANGQFPIKSNGNVIRATAGTVAYGVDLRSLTISSLAFGSNGFAVDGSGNMTAAQIIATGAVLPGAGIFSAGTGKIYTSIGSGGLGLVLTAQDSGSSGTNDLGFYSIDGSELFVNPHNTKNMKFAGGGGTIGFGSGAFAANGTVATSLGSLGPTGAHTTVQKWFKINDGTNTYYIPAF